MSQSLNQLRCAECGEALGVSLEEIPNEVALQIRCYLCAHNLCDIATMLGRRDLFDSQQLYELFSDSSFRERCHEWRWKIVKALEDFHESGLKSVIRKVKDAGLRIVTKSSGVNDVDTR